MACNRQCLLLSDSEVAALVSEGWTHIGDFDTEAECQSSCCCCGCDVCELGGPTKWTITVAGIGNGDCADCTNLNGTHPLLYTGWTENPCICRWGSAPIEVDCPGGSTTGWVLTFNGTYWSLVYFLDAKPEYRLDAAEFNCEGENIMPLVTGPEPWCSNAPATITVTPSIEKNCGSSSSSSTVLP